RDLLPDGGTDTTTGVEHASQPPHSMRATGEPQAGSVARMQSGNGASASSDTPLLVVEKLVKQYPRKGTDGALAKAFRRKPAPEPDMFRAVDGISFSVDRGESVGLVGESGCGKSTTSTMVMRLIDKSDGLIMFDGENIGEIPAKQFAR